MDEIGRMVNRLSSKIKREFRNLPAFKKLDNVSSTNGLIIMYIYEHGGIVNQKDLEDRFGITRSTVSKVLSLMEQKNLIIRESEESDQRKKKIILTEDAIQLSKECVKEKNEFDNKMKKVLGDKCDEFMDCLKLLDDYYNGGKKND